MIKFKNISVLDSNSKERVSGVFLSFKKHAGIRLVGLYGDPRPPDHCPFLRLTKYFTLSQFYSDTHP